MRVIWNLILESIREFTADHAMLFAAAISFYSIVSLAPLLVIAVTIAGSVFGEDAARGEITEQITGVVGAEGASVVEMVLANASGPGSGTAAILSGAVLLFSASAVFTQLRTTLNVVFGTRSKHRGVVAYFLSKLISLALVMGMGVFVIVSLASSTFLVRLHELTTEVTPGLASFGKLIEFGCMTLLFTLIYAVMFRILPAGSLRGKPLWIGALATSLLFNVGRIGVGIYLGRSAVGSSYGAAGSLLVLLVWIYYSALIMLLGAEFTKVLARHFDCPSSKGIRSR